MYPFGKTETETETERTTYLENLTSDNEKGNENI